MPNKIITFISSPSNWLFYLVEPLIICSVVSIGIDYAQGKIEKRLSFLEKAKLWRDEEKKYDSLHRVTVSFENEPLEKVLDSCQAKGYFDWFLSYDGYQNKNLFKPITLCVKNMRLAQFVDTLFKQEPYLCYRANTRDVSAFEVSVKGDTLVEDCGCDPLSFLR